MPHQRAETSRIRQSDEMCLEHNVDMVMPLRPGGRLAGPYTPGARHAQVRNQRAMVEFPEEILRAAPQMADRAARELLRQIARYRPAQPCIAHSDRLHAPPFDEWRERASRDFDLRQFRHCNCGD